nr:hypothetical protein [Bacteroidota bacterium]
MKSLTMMVSGETKTTSNTEILTGFYCFISPAFYYNTPIPIGTSRTGLYSP